MRHSAPTAMSFSPDPAETARKQAATLQHAHCSSLEQGHACPTGPHLGTAHHGQWHKDYCFLQSS